MEIYPENIPEIELAVSRYFDADEPAKGKNSLTYDQFFNRLRHLLEYLLRSNQERLWQGLYRIDVPEEKVKQAYAAGSIHEISEKLAVLIINREAQKAELRKKYSSKN